MSLASLHRFVRLAKLTAYSDRSLPRVQPQTQTVILGTRQHLVEIEMANTTLKQIYLVGDHRLMSFGPADTL
jgi:hypothetical protein